jgi:hypothetical protein
MSAQISKQALVLLVSFLFVVHYLCIIVLPISHHFTRIFEYSSLVLRTAWLLATLLNQFSYFTFDDGFCKPWVVSEIIGTLSLFNA